MHQEKFFHENRMFEQGRIYFIVAFIPFWLWDTVGGI
jgi:hypothetical protein